VAGLGEENPRNLLGIHLNGHGVLPWTVKHGGNLAGNTHAPRCILVELALSGLGYYDFRHFVFSFPWSGTERQLSAVSY
jgi:hypothetical protein